MEKDIGEGSNELSISKEETKVLPPTGKGVNEEVEKDMNVFPNDQIENFSVGCHFDQIQHIPSVTHNNTTSSGTANNANEASGMSLKSIETPRSMKDQLRPHRKKCRNQHNRTGMIKQHTSISKYAKSKQPKSSRRSGSRILSEQRRESKLYTARSRFSRRYRIPIRANNNEGTSNMAASESTETVNIPREKGTCQYSSTRNNRKVIRSINTAEIQCNIDSPCSPNCAGQIYSCCDDCNCESLSPCTPECSGYVSSPCTPSCTEESDCTSSSCLNCQCGQGSPCPPDCSGENCCPYSTDCSCDSSSPSIEEEI